MIDGSRFRILAIVDDFTRECLALVADTSLPGLRVARMPIMLLNHDGAASPPLQEPENSSFRRSKEWSQSKSTWDSAHRWMKEGAQVTTCRSAT
jgi:transposase InsO family protein